MIKEFHDSLHEWGGILFKYKHKPYDDMGEVWQREIKEVVALIRKALNDDDNSIEAGVKVFMNWFDGDYENSSPELKMVYASSVRIIIDKGV